MPSANDFTQTLSLSVEHIATCNISSLVLVFILLLNILCSLPSCQSLVCKNVSFGTKKTFTHIPSQ